MKTATGGGALCERREESCYSIYRLLSGETEIQYTQWWTKLQIVKPDDDTHQSSSCRPQFPNREKLRKKILSYA